MSEVPNRRPRSKQMSRDLIPWSYPLFGFAVVGLLMIVYLCQYAQLVRTQYCLVELKAKQQSLARTQSNLELQIQELTSLERVETIAVSRLKMAPPAQRQVVDLVAWEKSRQARQVAAVSLR